MIRLFTAAILLLQGCTHALSPDLAENAAPISFANLETDPERYAGKLVVLGGIISRATNTADGTLIEVLQKPLDYWGKPLRGKDQGALFLVLHSGYLDVLVYGGGRGITVGGIVAGGRRKGLSTDVTLPLLISRELKLWPRERRTWTTPSHLDPLYDPYASPRQY